MPITTLFFDLDGTIYPNDNGIWDRVSDLMNEFVHTRLGLPMEEVPALRKKYFQEYGTTLKGLLHHHDIDAHEYLEFVHNIDYPAYLQPDPKLQAMLASLRQRKWVLTNASRGHAQQVLQHLDVIGYFDGIIDILDMKFENKPHSSAYLLALERAGNPEPHDCLFIDDVVHNLDAAREIGMATVLISDAAQGKNPHQVIRNIYALPQILKLLKDAEVKPR